MKLFLKFVLFTSMAYSPIGCGKKKETATGGIGIFSFTASSIVNEATPASLMTASAQSALNPASVMSQIKERLYLSRASNSIPSIISAFDAVIANLNTRAASMLSAPACLGAEPASRSILTPDFQAFALYLQCFDKYSDNAFIIWGQDSNKNMYIYERSSASISAAKITPQAEGKFIFNAYIATNYLDGENSSGTIVKLIADQTAKSVQVSLAAPHEVCGVSIYADSSSIHYKGSVSTATENECPAESTGVFQSSDLTETSGFDGSKLLALDFSFRRKSGTKLVNAAVTSYQEYANQSGQGNVSLNQATSPATNGSDLNFGPSTADELVSGEFK